MAKKFYLDESGNTGDVTLAAPTFEFEDQPFFVLACFGINDEQKLDTEITRLRAKYKVQGAELKFSSLRRKPKLMQELIAFLHDADCPIMIEATDKRYSICINLIESLIVPSVGPMDFGQEARLIKNVFADKLMAELSDDVLRDFCKACHDRTRQSMKRAFTTFGTWITSMPDDEVMLGISKFFEDTKSDFWETHEHDMKAIERLLPVPDATRNGKALHILPHVYSMLHIYGRLNRYSDGQLAEISLYHDEQSQFDQALHDGMKLAESGVGDGLPRQPVADFRSNQKATLSFHVSHSSIGVQVADLLAGMVAYGLEELREPSSKLSSEWQAAFRDLLSIDDAQRGVGVNVVSASDIARRFAFLPYTRVT